MSADENLSVNQSHLFANTDENWCIMNGQMQDENIEII